MSPSSIGGGANIITDGKHISPASLKRQEEVLPEAKLEQRRYKDSKPYSPVCQIKQRKFRIPIDRPDMAEIYYFLSVMLA